jgi:hypothetical protein
MSSVTYAFTGRAATLQFIAANSNFTVPAGFYGQLVGVQRGFSATVSLNSNLFSQPGSSLSCSYNIWIPAGTVVAISNFSENAVLSLFNG